MTETRPTLFVVDDETVNIDILIEALSKIYTVRVDTDGPVALISAKECMPDMILLDIMMPGMDRFEVCSRLKNGPAVRDLSDQRGGKNRISGGHTHSGACRIALDKQCYLLAKNEKIGN